MQKLKTAFQGWIPKFAALGLVFLAACEPGAAPQGLTQALGIKPSVKVALLLPYGSSNAGVVSIAKSSENAARLAMAGLGDNVKMEIVTYDSKGDATVATNEAVRAVNEGAQIIVGPLFAEAANAVGKAVADSGVSVLTLSNNVDIAGGNVYVMGNTFQNSADRLVKYAFSQGKKRALVVHAGNAAGEAGARAIAQALEGAGLTNQGAESYQFSQMGIIESMGRISSKVQSGGTDVLLLTANYSSGLELLAQMLPEAGINPFTTQYAGISRWDAHPPAFKLPGIQGGWFTLPNPQRVAAYEARYQAAYGAKPHDVAAAAFDGIAAIGASVATGDRNALTGTGLTRRAGFQGAAGIFRLNQNGQNQRGLAVASVQGNDVVILENAPESFGNFGF